MPICALEIRTSNFDLGLNIPASTTLICYQWSTICRCDFASEGCIFFDGVEAVGDGQGWAFELAQGLGEIVIGLLWEY